MEQHNHNLPANTTPGAPVPEAPVPPTHRFAFADADAYDDDDGGGPGLKRYIAAVFYYKWLVLLTIVVGGAAGVFLSQRAPLDYQAEARMWISVTDRGTQMQGPIQSSALLQGNGWVQLLSSFSVLDSVVDSQRLRVVREPQHARLVADLQLDSLVPAGQYRLTVDATGSVVSLRSQDGVVSDQAAPGEPIGESAGFAWTPPVSALSPGLDVGFTILTPRTAARDLLASLTPQLAPGGTFLSIQYNSPHRAGMAEVLNAVADRYVTVAAELKSAQLVDVRNTLESQLSYAEENLRAAELALENFRIQTITLPSDQGTPVAGGLESTQASVLSNFFDLKTQREQLDRDMGTIERLLADAGTPDMSVDALNFVPAVQQSPELSQALQELTEKRAALRALEQDYLPEHPLVRSALADLRELETGVVPRLARALLNELSTQGATIDGLIDSASTELQEIPPRAIDEARLRRAVATAENLYNDLRQRFEGARLAAATSSPDVRIVDYATEPERPASDPRTMIIALAALVGLGLGVGLAILLERMDPRIRYAEQVSDGMRLGVLGALPTMPTGRRFRLFGKGNEMAEMTEALRGIRLAVSNAYGAAGPLILAISSPGSGDGKTFTTSRLAATYAQLRKRTLIIDGDTRRGDMHKLFELKRRPGLTDYLAGRRELSDIIRPTGQTGLDMIPCGSRLSEAPDLLSSDRMGELLSEIKPRYDVILIDSPPLGAGVDSLILGSLAGNMMLVMRPGTTDRALAEAKLGMLDRLPIRLLGVVLNGTGSDNSYRYYSYLPGYEAADEESEDADRLLPA